MNYVSSADAANDVANAIRSTGGEAMVVKANVSEKEQIDGLLKSVIDQWGTIDVLVNNAGELTEPAALQQL